MSGMTSELELLLLDHATGRTPWTAPAQWYAAYFLDGTEISGDDYARQPVDFAAAVALSETVGRAGSADPTEFPPLPLTDVDELRIVNTASGAITLTGWIIPYLRSFPGGSGNSFPADGIAVGFGTPS